MPQVITVNLSVANGRIVKRRGGVIFDGNVLLNRGDKLKFTSATPFALFVMSFLSRRLIKRGAIPRAKARFAIPFAPPKHVYESDANDELVLTVRMDSSLGEYTYALAVESGSQIITQDPRIIIE